MPLGNQQFKKDLNEIARKYGQTINPNCSPEEAFRQACTLTEARVKFLEAWMEQAVSVFTEMKEVNGLAGDFRDEIEPLLSEAKKLRRPQ